MMRPEPPANDRRDWKLEWFPIDDATYLNFASHGVIPRIALHAVQASVEAKKRPHIVDDAAFFHTAASVRASLARVIRGHPDEIALTNGAGAGVAIVAYGLTWRRGDEVIIAAGEFPMHYASWKPLEEREGIVLKVIPARGRFLDADDLIAAMTPRTRVVSVSHVRFDDGSMIDARRLAAACRANGTLLVLDVSQSCGAIPLDVHELGADIVVCAAYKYLLSPWGTGFLWAAKERLQALRPGPYNWLSQGVVTFARLNYVNPAPSPTMSRWDTAESSSLYNFNLTVMEASLRFVLEADPVRIRHHCQHLIDYLFERLPDGCRRASPMESSRRGAFGCLEADDPTATEWLYHALRNANFVVALREGRIRVAPHLLNSIDDMDRLIATISQLMREKSHVKYQ